MCIERVVVSEGLENSQINLSPDIAYQPFKMTGNDLLSFQFVLNAGSCVLNI